MNLPVILTPEARSDFDRAADWYEDQAGLGLRFTAHVRQALDRIGLMPEAPRTLYRDVRRAKVQRYSYYIYYRVQSDRVEVLAVLHGRRDPSVWKGRA